MRDAHLGKGATVGSVIPTVGAIMPAAVGVDLGCGMIAVRTQWTLADFETGFILKPLWPLRELIERAIPLSLGKYNSDLKRASARRRVSGLEAMEGAKEATQAAGNWHLQLGTLGGGNHFIEIVVDELSRVWAFLHSGSRGVGNKLAQKHIKVAQDECHADRLSLPDRDLAYLREERDSFWEYIRDLKWAQEFALVNREEMMDRVLDCLQEFMGERPREFDRINCHHNYTTIEHHYASRCGCPARAPSLRGTSPRD
jgi:tRNA-splicing ligase RtcB (3'-phosphate/5'-hydroxy nucleic acid ligase)